MDDKSSLLMTEEPLIINKKLATIIGLNEAIIVQQIEYWVNINKKANKKENYKENFFWTYNSVKKWTEQFPFWSKETVKRTLNKLREKEILIVGIYNKESYDKTLWYRINYFALNELEEEYDSKQVKVPEAQLYQLIGKKYPSRKVKNTHQDGQKIPTNKTNINKTNINKTNKSSSSKEENEEEVDTDVSLILKESSKINLKLSRKVVEQLLTGYNLKEILRIIAAINNPEEIKNVRAYMQKALVENSKEVKVTKNITNNIKSDGVIAASNIKSYGKKETRFNNYAQREYDYEELEDELLGWPKQL